MTLPATLAERYVDAIRRGNLGLSARLQDELEAERVADAERFNRPGALLNAAAWYARQGVHVFPCEPRGKRPLVKDWPGKATTDVDRIVRFWTSRPDANIGAPTGRLFDVIDLDGREGVLSAYSGDPPLLVDTVTEIGHAMTSREAGHHLFIPAAGHGNRAGMLPGVDYRGAGGYVILPPSVGANGNRYRWTRPLQLDQQHRKAA